MRIPIFAKFYENSINSSIDEVINHHIEFLYTKRDKYQNLLTKNGNELKNIHFVKRIKIINERLNEFIEFKYLLKDDK